MRELSSRLFSFGGHVVKVACLQPPEAQARLTLTWQLPQAPDTNEEQSAPPPDEIGLSIWPAAIALCEYIARNSALVKGTEVVELGAGVSGGGGGLPRPPGQGRWPSRPSFERPTPLPHAPPPLRH